MIVSTNYKNFYADTPLKQVYSDNGFYVIYDNLLYENVIVPASTSLNLFTESTTPIAEKVLSTANIIKNILNNTNFTKTQANTFREFLLSHLTNVSDEEAINYKFFWPEWNININYNEGNIVIHDNRVYRVLTSHTSSAMSLPPNSNYYSRITGNTYQLLDYIPNTSYQKTDRIRYGSHVYESLINDNFWSPVDFPDAWRLIT